MNSMSPAKSSAAIGAPVSCIPTVSFWALAVGSPAALMVGFEGLTIGGFEGSTMVGSEGAWASLWIRLGHHP